MNTKEFGKFQFFIEFAAIIFPLIKSREFRDFLKISEFEVRFLKDIFIEEILNNASYQHSVKSVCDSASLVCL